MVPLPHMIGNQMIATTLYLPKDLYQQIGELARQNKKPKAQIVREFIQKGLSQNSHAKGATAQFFKNLSKVSITGGPKDLSINHDKYAWE